MAKDTDRELERLNNHLISDTFRQGESSRVRNTDKTDVDLDQYSAAVEQPAKKHRGCLSLVLLLLILIAVILLWGGELPWK